MVSQDPHPGPLLASRRFLLKGESTHQVAAFDSVRAGVAYYLLTLNSHPAYAALRARRQDLQSAGQPVTGDALAEGLLRYSERGQSYVDEIKQMIRGNGLESRSD